MSEVNTAFVLAPDDIFLDEGAEHDQLLLDGTGSQHLTTARSEGTSLVKRWDSVPFGQRIQIFLAFVAALASIATLTYNIIKQS